MVYDDQQKDLKHMWHANLVVIPGASHVVMWEAPDEFNAVLVDFLKRHSITPAHKYYG
jgi:pimeloyl-ACP methyl ester carboxylesterase